MVAVEEVTTVALDPGLAAGNRGGERDPLKGEGLAARRFGWSTLLVDLLGDGGLGPQTPADDPFVGSVRDELRSMSTEVAGEAARRLNRRAAAAAAAARRLRPG